MNITDKRIADWRKYERIRAGGRWNMFDPRAQKATRLSNEDYLFCLQHYDELKAAAERRGK